MPAQNIGQSLKIGVGQDGAAWVGRGVENEPFTARGDCGLKIGGHQAIPLGGTRWNGDGRAAAQAHHIGIADPIGRGKQHFIACVHTGHKGIEQNMLAPSADDQIFMPIAEPVFARELGADRLLEGGQAVGLRIAGVPLFNGANARLGNMSGRIKIRFPRAERHDIRARRLERGSARTHFNCGRGGNLGETMG